MTIPTSRKDAKACGSKRYLTGAPCPQGHIAERLTSNGGCITCQISKSTRYKQDNKEPLKEKRKTYISANREKIRETANAAHRRNSTYRNALRAANRVEKRDEILVRERKYYEGNRELLRESRRDYYRAYMKQRRTDPEFKAKTRMRDMIRRTLARTGLSKETRTEELLGYRCADLRAFLESKFLEGMTWDNYGAWHIDHIISIKAMVDSGITDPAIINALSNLQPLWSFDNLSKGAL
ncbi:MULTISPECIES: hypothetical protein [Pseudomonas]|uniref:hypothetical protein n=1 Tax=Pseudomonas TaxID=286 RepID=UPI002360AFDD|nr:MULTISPECIES: hypothetical protein [Pseudomonas]WJV25917.1 hypothetical protein PSR66_07780 [Pseudomonas chlororaphis]